jgi:hypothetical protein
MCQQLYPSKSKKIPSTVIEHGYQPVSIDQRLSFVYSWMLTKHSKPCCFYGCSCIIVYISLTLNLKCRSALLGLINVRKKDDSLVMLQGVKICILGKDLVGYEA